MSVCFFRSPALWHFAWGSLSTLQLNRASFLPSGIQLGLFSTDVGLQRRYVRFPVNLVEYCFEWMHGYAEVLPAARSEPVAVALPIMALAPVYICICHLKGCKVVSCFEYTARERVLASDYCIFMENN